MAPLSLPRVAFFVLFFFPATAVLDRVPSVAATFDGRVFSLLAFLAGGGEVATDPSASGSVAPLPVLRIQRPNNVDANVDTGTGFRIRIHFLRIRIRIQRIRMEANTDPGL